MFGRGAFFCIEWAGGMPMTDRQAIEHLRAVRIFCDPMQVQAVDWAIAALRAKMYEERKTHPVG